MTDEAILETILQDPNIKALTRKQQAILQTVTPILMEALPTLLRKLDNSEQDEDIEPLRFLGQFLFRHNPKHTM